MKKTGYKNIYYNENTKKYAIKYNYTVYNPLTQESVYKSKWIYNQATLTMAKKDLAQLQANSNVLKDKDITLKGIFELWKDKAVGQNYSRASIRNTEQQVKMIYKFLPPDTRLKDITEEVYYKLSSDCRNYGYSEETLHSINACFRKLINLSYKKKLTSTNILHTADNIRTRQKEDYKIMSFEDFQKIRLYFRNNNFYRLGKNNYPLYELLFTILYYTGIRIGEGLALKFSDMEEFNYYKKGEEPMQLYIPSDERTNEQHLRGNRLKITKAFVSEFNLTKDPKNFKKRSIPMPYEAEKLFIKMRNNHLNNGGNLEDDIFPWKHGACATMLKNVCKKLEIDSYTCHSFRHTYISNLISQAVPLPVIEKVSGDTQETILKRYSHMFEHDEVTVLNAMKNL